MHRISRRVASCRSSTSILSPSHLTRAGSSVSAAPKNRTSTKSMPPPSGKSVTLATALVGSGVGLGYVTFRLLQRTRRCISSSSSRNQGKPYNGAGDGAGAGDGKQQYPMIDMADLARRTVQRKKSFLYTRSGDKGTSQLYNMETRPKSDASFEALGNMDELNACLGLAAEHSSLAENGLTEMLQTVQSRIIDASALVATPRDSSSARKISRTGFPAWCTDQLEACIDELDARTPPLKTFVVPGGGLAASQLHLARCVCRRAERSLQPLLGAGQGVEEVARYVNRLSDLLFASARYASMVDGKPERPWEKLPPAEEEEAPPPTASKPAS
ncbi:unnamed protein product [Pylaiella littoralis]